MSEFPWLSRFLRKIYLNFQIRINSHTVVISNDEFTGGRGVARLIFGRGCLSPTVLKSHHWLDNFFFK